MGESLSFWSGIKLAVRGETSGVRTGNPGVTSQQSESRNCEKVDTLPAESEGNIVFWDGFSFTGLDVLLHRGPVSGRSS